MAYCCYRIPCYQLFSFLSSDYFRRTLALDIISSQINDPKPIPFCLNNGESLPSYVLKFKYILNKFFPLKFSFLSSDYFRRTLSLDIISSQINDLKPIPFCLNYGESLPSNVLKFKCTLKQNFPPK